MAEDRNKILSKAQKLKELAVRGVGGEMDNAKSMLDVYMKKHNITESELAGFTAIPNSNLSHLSDEEFMQEMIIEIIPVGLGILFGRYSNDKTKAQTKEQASVFVNKFLTEIFSRVDKMTKKK